MTSPQGLHTILWNNDFKKLQYEKILSHLIRSPRELTILSTKNQLSEYFQGKRKKFDLPLGDSGNRFSDSSLE